MNQGRVVVHTHAGSDELLAELSGSSPIVVQVLVAVVATLVIIGLIASTVEDIATNGAGYAVALAVVILLVAGLTVRTVGAVTKRAREVPGSRWVSRSATFLGPYDDRIGVAGSASFAAANRSHAFDPPIVRLTRSIARRMKQRRTAGRASDSDGRTPSSRTTNGPRLGRRSRPFVRLVLTDEALAVVPGTRRNEPLQVPLAAIAVIGVTTTRRRGGVTVRTDDGRSAAFLTFPDLALVAQLTRLGFTAEDS